MSPGPFRGISRKLVLAFDVGTTYSGVGYAILDPGETPKIQVVTRFPGQETGDSKIPTIMYYTQDGSVRAAGAEARHDHMFLAAEEEDLIFVEWFKLHLRPSTLKSDGLHTTDLPPLPPGKTVVQVFGDFLSYLFNCAKTFIVEAHPNGASLWSSFEDRIEIVLSHPNGWEGAQQSMMRKAAVYAHLIPDTSAGHARIHFVTEGEASLLYCLDHGVAANVTRGGVNVMIVDAGGGTVDISTYKLTKMDPMSAEEIAQPDCILQGSTRINIRAREFLKEKLQYSLYGNDEDINAMMESFEKHAKPTFKDPADRSFIKFGSIRDRDPDVGIRSGQLVLEGATIASFFQPVLDGIANAVHKQRSLASEPVNLIFLVGGFAASPWLYAHLKAILGPAGMDVSRPDPHTNKAVAEGAVSHHLKNIVSARVARLTYGVPCAVAYDPTNEEHLLRGSLAICRPSGRFYVPGGFDPILTRGTRLSENTEVRCPVFADAADPESLNSVSGRIMCYRGSRKNPLWQDLEPECFMALCTVEADTSRVAKKRRIGPDGPYYAVGYYVVLSCGLTEMKAQIAWIQNGQEIRGDAKIVYDDIPPAF